MRLRAAVPAQADRARRRRRRPSPAPGVLEAIAAADVVLLPPSNPVVSIGTILAVPGIARGGRGPETGGRGVPDHRRTRRCAAWPTRCLAAIGVETTAAAVAAHYGPDLLDGWLVDERGRRRPWTRVELAGIAVRAVPLLMTDPGTAAADRPRGAGAGRGACR